MSIRSGLKPLDRLASEVSARTPGNLAALPAANIPTEVRPLVSAINRLFVRVGRALDNERRFTADAAHELRTPLAALKVQTQVAQLATDAPMRQHALRQIETGVDRAGHLVEQLLRLARLDPLQQPATPEPVALDVLARDVLREIRGAHPGAARNFGESLPAGGTVVRGDADLLRIALRNLLDNALRYTRDGDAISLEVDSDGERAGITVRDSGPGVAMEDLSRLAERFYRGRDKNVEGSGLGLAIATRIAELHGARLRLGNCASGGFVARIDGLRLAAAPLDPAPQAAVDL